MAMTDDLKKDMFILMDGELYLVTDRKYKTQGRQGGLIILDMKNVRSKQSLSKTVKAGTKFEQVIPEYKEMQYLYKDDSSLYFMDTSDFSTVDVAIDFVGDYVNYLKEGEKYVVLFYEGSAISFRKNSSVELKVTESVDAVRGNTANNATKLVTTETGYKVAVPLFIKTGDMISINTETGAYTGRV